MDPCPSALQEAVLLLGPTGAGKSPLGDWLQAHGLWGRPCHHFDFGAHLRAVAAGGRAGRFTAEEIEFIRRVLAEGALLENERFALAARILKDFLAQHRVLPEHWLVLNGLPRHVGQAEALVTLVQVRALIQLECNPQVIVQRLTRDPAGDRAARQDDDLALVARKLELYEARTRPLVTFYQRRGATLLTITIGPETLPGDVARQLEAGGGPLRKD